MHMFGLKSTKSLGVARFGGLRFLRIRRREANPGASDIQYLRHAGAMSAAIAKNMSSLMSQSSDFIQSSTKSETSDFLEAHSHYSFIAVVALMSLFLVVTISATGLLLAFCRKKNTVFTAPAKSDNDSQFELDDIDSSDVEICRGDKGECYMHLSDDYDEDDDEEDCNGKNSQENDNEDNERNGHCTKQLTRFQRIREILKHYSSLTTSKKPKEFSKQKSSKSVAPLLHSNKIVRSDSQTGRNSTDLQENSTKRTSELQEKQMKHRQQDWVAGYSKVVCHNPNHKHQYNHFNFLHRHHHHQRQSKPHGAGRTHIVHPCCQHHFSSSSGRLQRSHTIHAIPQTAQRSQSKPVSDTQTSSIKITIEDVDATKDVVVLDPVPHDVTPIQHKPPEASEMDIFNDADDDQVSSKTKSPFDNLQLRLEDDSYKEGCLNQIDHVLEKVNIESHRSPSGDSVNTTQNVPSFDNGACVWVRTENEGSSAFSTCNMCFPKSESHQKIESDAGPSPHSTSSLPLSSSKESNTFEAISDVNVTNLQNISKATEPFQSQTSSHESQPTELPSTCDTDFRQSLPTRKVVRNLLENANSTSHTFNSIPAPSGSNSEFNQGPRGGLKSKAQQPLITAQTSPQTVKCQGSSLDIDNPTSYLPLVKFSNSAGYSRSPSHDAEEHEMGNSGSEQETNTASKENSFTDSVFNVSSKRWELHSNSHHGDNVVHVHNNDEGDDDAYYLIKSDYDGDDDEDDQTAALLK